MLPARQIRHARECTISSVKRRAYTASLESDGGYWSLRIPRVERSTRVASGDEAEPTAREIIAGTLGIAVDSFDVTVVELRPDRASLHAGWTSARGAGSA
jgi:hypothetical protein